MTASLQPFGTGPAHGARSSGFAFLIAFVASVGGFLFGFDLAIVCGANLYLKEVFQLSPAEFGFATGSAALGCILGPFLGVWMCDAVGRVRTMIVASRCWASARSSRPFPTTSSRSTSSALWAVSGWDCARWLRPCTFRKPRRRDCAAASASCTSWPLSSAAWPRRWSHI